MNNKELRELDLELPPCQTITLKDWNEGKVSLRKNLIAEFERPLKEEIQSLESSLDIKEAELSQSRFSKALDIDKARQEAREILQKEFDVKSEQLRKEVRKECIEELKKIGLNRIGFNRLVGFPRSELYEQFLREGLVRHEYEGILIPDTHHNHADEITELGHSKFPEIMDYNKDHTI